MIGILQVKHPPQKFPDKVYKKYQHEERYKPTKCHIYIKMTMKCKFQMACNPSNINHFEKNVLGERQYPHKSKHQHNTTKSQKLNKSSMDMER